MKRHNILYRIDEYVDILGSSYRIFDIDSNSIYTYCLYDENNHYVGWFKEEAFSSLSKQTRLKRTRLNKLNKLNELNLTYEKYGKAL